MKLKNLFVIMASMLITAPSTAKSKFVQIKIIETSDVHGCFFPYDFIERKDKKGSLARVSTYVKNLRKQYGNNVILLENGDLLQGQPTCYYYNYINKVGNNVASDVINYLGYDAQCFGNHDVEVGHPAYDKWISELNCPVLGANIIDTKTGKPYVEPYKMFNRDGVKIAVIGMLTPAIPNWLSEDLWSGLHFEDIKSCMVKWVNHIKENERPDFIVALIHSGWDGGIVTEEYVEDQAKTIAEQVPGIDIVLYGHDHRANKEYITNIEGQQVLCLDPSNNALNVCEATITVELDKKGRIIQKKITGDVVDITGEEIDLNYMAKFKPQIDTVTKYIDKPLAEFTAPIYTRDGFFGSSAFIDLIHNIQLKVVDADVSMNAPLGYNSKIDKGTIRVSDMFKLYKYENKLYVIRMTGREIRNMLEMSYDLWVNTMTSPDDHIMLLNDESKTDMQRRGFKNMTFNFDSAAGIDYEVDVTKPKGQKVRILQMSNGQPFNEDREYRVAMNSYRGNGGGELITVGAGIPKSELESHIIYKSQKDMRQYIMEEIQNMGTVNAKPNNNWRFVPTELTEPAIKRDRALLFNE